MHVFRLLTATALAALLTVLAALGVVRLLELASLPSRVGPIAVSDTRVDFGRVRLHASESRAIVVRNDTERALEARFVVEGAAYHVEPEQLVLHPGIEWSITIVVTPERPGRLDDLLRIELVGAADPAVLIPLQATAGAGGSPDGMSSVGRTRV